MDTSIAIYTDLLIAFAAIIAPLLLYSLSIHSEALVFCNTNNNEKEKTLENLFNQDNGKSPQDKAIENYAHVRKERKKMKRSVCLLSPEKQIKHLYGSFGIALILLLAYHLLSDGHSSLWPFLVYIRGIVIVCSIGIFIHALLRSKNIALQLIEVKRNFAKVKLRPNANDEITSIGEGAKKQF